MEPEVTISLAADTPVISSPCQRSPYANVLVTYQLTLKAFILGTAELSTKATKERRAVIT